MAFNMTADIEMRLFQIQKQAEHRLGGHAQNLVSDLVGHGAQPYREPTGFGLEYNL